MISSEAPCGGCDGRGMVPAESELFAGVYGNRRCGACGGKGKVPRPPMPWRKEPPTVDEVKAHSWWWNKPPDGTTPPHVMRFDVYRGIAANGDAIDVIVDVNADGQDVSFDDWPGEWAPAVPPP